jgi:hypothetical protein
MDHESSSSKAKRSFRFIPDEVKEMEEKLKPRTTSYPDRVLMRELALKFNESRGSGGTTSPVKPKQARCSSAHRSSSRDNSGFLSSPSSIRSALGNSCPQVLNWFRYHRYCKSNKKVAASEAPPAPRSMTGFRADQQHRPGMLNSKSSR